MKGPAAMVAVLGGLGLIGGTLADWTATTATAPGIDVVVRRVATPGTVYAAPAVALGLIVLIGGVVMLVLPRLAAVVVGVAALAGAVTVAAGAVRAGAAGALQSGPGMAGLGAVAGVTAAVLALRRQADPPSGDQPSRYTVEGAAGEVGDDEWELATTEDSR